MTPEERDLIRALMVIPGGAPAVSPQSVLTAFGVVNGAQLVHRLVSEALAVESWVDVETAMIAAATFGMPVDLVDPLIRLVEADWHHCHEDITWWLGELAAPRAVPALLGAAERIPDYLELDESRALGRKAIHALGRIPGPEATQALVRLSCSDDSRLASVARRQLESRL